MQPKRQQFMVRRDACLRPFPVSKNQVYYVNIYEWGNNLFILQELL